MSSSGTFPKGSSHGKRAGQEKGGRGGGGGSYHIYRYISPVLSSTRVVFNVIPR